MSREPLHSYEDRPEQGHARANRPRAIDARRRTALVGAAIAAVVVVVVLVLAL